MFFSKEVLQEDNVKYEDKEVLELLNDYCNNVYNMEDAIDEERKKTLEIIRNYCNKFYKSINLSSIDEDFYNKFILFYIPSFSLTLSEQDIKLAIGELGKMIQFINEYHGINLNKSYKRNLNSNLEESLRIFYIIRKIQKYTESPVLSFSPMIIDMDCYKKSKNSNKQMSKKEIYEQGQFEIIDKIGGIIILKKTKLKSHNTYIKIKVENNLASNMHFHDIINMRIKKRFFYSTWDIIDIKDYYSYKSYDYVK
jgi:hypothetical protein